MSTSKIHLFNTLKREKQEFVPVHEGRVGMYVCGPTVYGEPHLGHARGALTFDIVYRVLEAAGFKVRYVKNITDVGHLEDEVQGAGEDKIAKKARLEQLEPMEVVYHYTVKYHQAMDALGILRPSIEPTATGHICEQIIVIEDILKNGFAYEVNGSVYFDMEKYSASHNYGELSGKVLDDLLVGSRGDLEGSSEKRNPKDFALWKKAKAEHIMKWPSPWGEGFPGWHLECTAMSKKYLGFPFDIHGGGMDLEFPHHEAEIAQSKACGHTPVNYWMHNNMVTLDGQKMAKSKGNFITLDEMFSGEHELLEQSYTPMVIRFFMLQSHYRSPIDFSNVALQAAEKGLEKLLTANKLLKELVQTAVVGLDQELDSWINNKLDEVWGFLADDFNTAQALAALFELSAKVNSFYHKQLDVNAVSVETFGRLQKEFIWYINDLLGLKEEESSSNHLDEVMDILIGMRNQARTDKNYALSDEIRDSLKEAGIVLKDEKGQTTYDLG